ncbi:PREDICTED: uncharacterized protein LOC109166752 [Ipomoea nil]|uniref:uncharacterized protein LOC109166752 n=1 Tax=Ipomoea nil TaxID=35883 RepID=UPI000901139C|nr:PREDICTED: uncharacterized protein LOC109166752 [Ipomoea nil]
MTDCKPLATPASLTQPVSTTADLFDNPTQYRRLAGALQYLTITRPDLSYAVNRLCQFMHAPTQEHWSLLKRVLRYVKGTLAYGLRLAASPSTDIHAYSDSDWAGCPVDRKSTSGYAVFIGTNLVSGYHGNNALSHVHRPKPSTKALLMLPLRTKHVEIDYHFVRDKVASGAFQVNFISTKDQVADIFTKPLPALRFTGLRDKLNVVPVQPCT